MGEENKHLTDDEIKRNIEKMSIEIPKMVEENDINQIELYMMDLFDGIKVAKDVNLQNRRLYRESLIRNLGAIFRIGYHNIEIYQKFNMDMINALKELKYDWKALNELEDYAVAFDKAKEYQNFFAAYLIYANLLGKNNNMINYMKYMANCYRSFFHGINYTPGEEIKNEAGAYREATEMGFKIFRKKQIFNK